MSSDNENKLKLIKQSIKSYKDFPKKGVVFRDFFSLLREPNLFQSLIEILIDHVKQLNTKITCVVGLESRGFLIGPIIALELKIPFVPIRKKGKLPGQLKSIKYQLEYGEDIFEIQTDDNSTEHTQQVLIFDDLLATGGTLKAACQLLKECQMNVVECLVIIELVDLKGRDKLNVPIHSLTQF